VIGEQGRTNRDVPHPVGASEMNSGSVELTYSPVSTSFPMYDISSILCSNIALLKQTLWHTASPVVCRPGLGLGSFRKSGSTSGVRCKSLKS